MIELGLVEIASQYVHNKVPEIRRESVIMLGSLLSVRNGL